MSTALTVIQEKQIALNNFLGSAVIQGKIKDALPSHVKLDRFVRIALTAFNQNPKIYDCTRESVALSLMKAAASGLEVGRECHIIPYGNEAQFQADYKGLASMLRRSGEVADVHADVVYSGDEFSYCYGTGSHLKHKPARGARGDPVEVYSYVRFKDGSESFDVMNVEQVNAVRDQYSRGYDYAIRNGKKDHPWINAWDAMACKTVFKKHSKWLPLSAELADALRNDDDDTLPDAGFEGARQINERPPVPEKEKGVTAMRNAEPPPGAEDARNVTPNTAAGGGSTETTATEARKTQARKPRAAVADPAPATPPANPPAAATTTLPPEPAKETPPPPVPAATPAAGTVTFEGPKVVTGEIIDAMDQAHPDETVGYRTDTIMKDGKPVKAGVVKKIEIAGFGHAYYFGKDVSMVQVNRVLKFTIVEEPGRAAGAKLKRITVMEDFSPAPAEKPISGKDIPLEIF